MCNHVEWDPSGRILASAVLLKEKNQGVRFQLESGYALWTFQGTQLLKQQKKELYQFLWRPRPKSLLTEPEVAEVMKNIKTYANRYKETDKLQANKKLFVVTKEKIAKREAFKEYLESRMAYYASQKASRIAVLNYDSDVEEFTTVEEEMEEIIQVEEIPY